MKRHILLIFTLIASIASAQFTVNQDSVYVLYEDSEPDLALYNSHQTLNPTITVKWEVVSVSVSNGWENDFFVCDAIQCWDSTTNSNQYDLIDNKNYPLDCHFLNNGNIGEGNAKIRIWEVGDSINSVKIVVYQVKVEEAVGIRAAKSNSLAIYPNPATNYLKFENIDNREIMKIEIFSIIGRKVKEIINPSNNESINVSNLDNGVYIIRLTDKKQNNYSQNFTKN